MVARRAIAGRPGGVTAMSGGAGSSGLAAAPFTTSASSGSSSGNTSSAPASSSVRLGASPDLLAALRDPLPPGYTVFFVIMNLNTFEILTAATP